MGQALCLVASRVSQRPAASGDVCEPATGVLPGTVQTPHLLFSLPLVDSHSRIHGPGGCGRPLMVGMALVLCVSHAC